jgi:hypothetical protein
MRWCPVLFSAAVQNAIAIARGAGVLKSIHPRLFEKHRGVESIKITSLIGQATYIYIPTRDAMG